MGSYGQESILEVPQRSLVIYPLFRLHQVKLSFFVHLISTQGYYKFILKIVVLFQQWPFDLFFGGLENLSHGLLGQWYIIVSNSNLLLTILEKKKEN